MRNRVAVFSLCLSFGSAAAAADSGLGADAEQVDACELLTSTEIADTVGLPVDDGINRDAGYEDDGSYSSACIWPIDTEASAEHDPAAPFGGRSFAILHVMKWPAGSGQSGKYLEAFRDAARIGEIPGEPVPRNFGEEALWWGDGLAVRQGDVSFGISVFLPKAPSGEPGVLEERLAPFVLRRLN